MKPAATSTPRNTNSNHPPLAHDADGHPIAMPDGSASWMLKRQTSGRPKVILGPDRRPARLPLDTTAEEVAETYGPGTYRLDALDALGNPIDHVTTLTIGDDESDEEYEARRSPGPRGGGSGSSDLRFALETITQMARATSSSLQAVAESQAEWVKGLAAARLIPRNALYAPMGTPMQLAAPVAETDEDDDEGEDVDEVSEAAPYVAIAQAANGIVQGIPALMQSITQTVSTVSALRNASKNAPAAPSSPSPSASNPMVHLSAINDRLSGPERRFLRHILRSEHADAVTRELLTRSVDDAVALVKQTIARVQAERSGSPSRGEEASTSAEAHGPAGDDDGDFMAHVTAIASLLSPEDRTDVMALLPRIAPQRLAVLKEQLLAMTVEDAVTWIRDNLEALKAEVAS